MTDDSVSAWRCFPWDEGARAGAAFSPSYLVPGQTVGRFDLHDRPAVRYLAESPEHAIGELLSAFRGTHFTNGYLRRGGFPLALVEVRLSAGLTERIRDCTRPQVLVELSLSPDHLAHHDRTVTQRIARKIHEHANGSATGLRWWSALTGARHTKVIFTDRETRGDVRFLSPELLQAGDQRLQTALAALGIRVR